MEYNRERCNTEANYISKAIGGGVISEGTCFRVKLGLDKEKNVYEFSISVPGDAYGNKLEDSGLPKTIETAIVCNNDIVYESDWGYDDIQRFVGEYRASDDENIAILVEEIQRVTELVIKKQ
jgi:hypothetical protein